MLNVKWCMLNCPDERRFTNDEPEDGEVRQVYLVCLVYFVSLVERIQSNQRNQIDQKNQIFSSGVRYSPGHLDLTPISVLRLSSRAL